MYENQFAPIRYARLIALVSAVIFSLTIVLQAVGATPAVPQVYNPDSVVCKISGASEKLELTTNTSRILTLDKNIPRVQVNNPELLAVTPLSATQVQISAKKAGVTQVNLWDEDGAIHSVDVQIFGDARELSLALQTQFPHASIKVYRYSESLVLTGFVDRPDHISSIMQLAQDYAPKVIDNITVGGVQQVLLKVKVMEISRTKLRQLGVDWAWFGGGHGSFAVSRPGGLISTFSSTAKTIETAGDTFNFGIIGNNAGFFGVLDALQNRQVAKILAEPNIVAVSGRPAQFNVGGEVPILVPQSLGTSSIEYKPFGTQIDFLPIVLGNGSIRLEVRPRVSFLDPTSGIQLNDVLVPGFNVRQVDTAVEMKAGQTFALAGLTQERTETQNSGLPYLSDVPVLGVPFRKTRDEVNEIELLIVVTPEFVDAMNADEVPCNGPGTLTTSPTSRGLYCAGHVEVPNYCNPTQGLSACGQDPCGNPNCNTCGQVGCTNGNCGTSSPAMNGHVVLPGGTGYDDGSGSAPVLPPATSGGRIEPEELSFPVQIEDHGAAKMPSGTQPSRVVPPQPAAKPAVTPPQPAPAPAAQAPGAPSAAVEQGGGPAYTSPRPYSPQRQPVFVRNASNPSPPSNPQGPTIPETASTNQNGLIGPVGYDVQ